MDDIVIEDLSKSYASGWPGRPPFVALDGLSLTVSRGEVFGFLGPNGAGKTTTLKILMGLVRATSGTAFLLGQPAGHVETRRRIGFLPESPYFYDYLTAEEFLEFYGRLAGLESDVIQQRVIDLLALVGLVDAKARQLRNFSKADLQTSLPPLDTGPCPGTTETKSWPRSSLMLWIQLEMLPYTVTG